MGLDRCRRGRVRPAARQPTVTDAQLRELLLALLLGQLDHLPERPAVTARDATAACAH